MQDIVARASSLMREEKLTHRPEQLRYRSDKHVHKVNPLTPNEHPLYLARSFPISTLAYKGKAAPRHWRSDPPSARPTSTPHRRLLSGKLTVSRTIYRPRIMTDSRAWRSTRIWLDRILQAPIHLQLRDLSPLRHYPGIPFLLILINDKYKPWAPLASILSGRHSLRYPAQHGNPRAEGGLWAICAAEAIRVMF